MPKRGRKYQKVLVKVDWSKNYTLEEALRLLKNLSYSKFEGSVELHLSINLPSGRDPKSVKGGISLPHVEAKSVKVALAVPKDLLNDAKEAGADIVGLDEVIKQIESGKLDFDVLLAVPQVMPQLAPFGKVLGPKGLMPNPKNGTVVEPKKLKEAVAEFKKGKILFKADAQGGIHIALGKINQPVEEIIENIKVVISSLVSMLGKSKESLIRKMYLAPTMGPAIKIDLKSL